MKGELRQNIFGLLSSVLVFLLFFLLIKWPIFIAAPISIGTFFGVYFLSKPKVMIGDIEMEKLANGLELKELYENSKLSVNQMKALSNKIKEKNIREKALDLTSVGEDILRYLEKNPRDLSESRHFLNYYLKTSNKILDNYIQLDQANVSDSKLALVTEKTQESLDLLNQVFSNQRDSYHKDALMELEVETELLEKTIKLGGDAK